MDCFALNLWWFGLGLDWDCDWVGFELGLDWVSVARLDRLFGCSVSVGFGWVRLFGFGCSVLVARWLGSVSVCVVAPHVCCRYFRDLSLGLVCFGSVPVFGCSVFNLEWVGFGWVRLLGFRLFIYTTWRDLIQNVINNLI